MTATAPGADTGVRRVTTVLVANRGEIARRVFRSCRDLGLGTVAVFSDADAGEPHVAEADAAVRLPGVTPAETYLRGELIVAAAHAAGADAVHPGYGFLSESAEFARAVEDAGLVWIGPPPAAIAAMGGKVGAKRLMAAAGVPVLDDLDPATITAADLPVLVKASAGGGGRGMRVVRELADLGDSLASARREAASAFGDPTVFCEPFVATGHHVEVQIMADVHGTVWAVGERECSIQRRHQKVIEEAPSPLVQRTAGLREAMFAAARAAAVAIGYVGAGTVEFLADDDGRFWFLETNTRLQVEHPVTECTTGLDLVALQLQVAGGYALPEHPPATVGHAVEVRLYAEDPAHGDRPQSGTVHRFAVPGVDAEFTVPGGEIGLRLDAGIVDGSVVGVHYDPMLAKIIAVAPTRTQAVDRLATAVARMRWHGPVTNRDLLVRVLRHPEFRAGRTDTAFLARHDVTAPLAGADTVRVSALAAALAGTTADHGDAPVQGGLPTGWRNVRSQPERRRFAETEVSWIVDRGVLRGHDDVDLVGAAADHVVLDVGGVRRRFDVARYVDADGVGTIAVDSSLGAVLLHPEPRFVDPADLVAPGSLAAPMPGTVVRIGVSVGDVVAAGHPLLWLEAMKMEHPVVAPAAGVVEEVSVTTGQVVEVGAILALVSADVPIGEGEPA